MLSPKLQEGVERALSRGTTTPSLERARDRVSAALTDLVLDEAIVQQGDKVYADTAFLNASRGLLPGFEMKHMGFGEFYLAGPGGAEVQFDRMRGKPFPGQSGRSHLVYDNKGGSLVRELLDAAQAAGLAEHIVSEGTLLDERPFVSRRSRERLKKTTAAAHAGKTRKQQKVRKVRQQQRARARAGGGSAPKTFKRQQTKRGRGILGRIRKRLGASVEESMSVIAQTLADGGWLSHSEARQAASSIYASRGAGRMESVAARVLADGGWLSPSEARQAASSVAASLGEALDELVAVDREDEDPKPPADEEKGMQAGHSFPAGLDRQKAKGKGTGEGQPGPERKKRTSAPGKPSPQSGAPGRKGSPSHSREERGRPVGQRRRSELGFDKGPGRATKPPQGRGGASQHKDVAKGIPSGGPWAESLGEDVGDVRLKLLNVIADAQDWGEITPIQARALKRAIESVLSRRM